MEGWNHPDFAIWWARGLALLLAAVEERALLAIAGERHSYTGTFLQQLMPWLPDWFVAQGVPLLTLGGLMGAVIQASLAIRKRPAR